MQNAPSTERVGEHLAAVWMAQACARPEHREAVFARLMAAAPASADHSPTNFGRGGLRSLFDAAVVALAWAFRDDPDAPVLTDPAATVRKIFPRLDRQHCVRLAELLIEEASK